MTTALAARWILVEYWLLDAKRYWRSVLVVGVIQPLLYVLALGVGLGAVIDRHGTTSLGVPYLAYVAPALLVALAVQFGASDASYPVLSKFKWERSFHGMAGTPLTPTQISDGTLLWITLRLIVNCAVNLAIMSLFGATRRWEAILAVPAAALCGLAMAAPVAAFSASRDNEGQGFNVLARFILMPMFLFAGTFYPIDRLPEWARWVAYLTPLWHGTDLARSAALGTGSAALDVVHVAYLVAMAGVGFALSRRAFSRRVAK
ncbi:MAG TPA: ABC transporter permease [Jatrophihabitans sp.]|jgi:lipooligosaccharide transport system permease protein